MREGDGQFFDRNWGDDDWDTVVDQIRDGECTPFLGAGACSGILPTGTELSERWATRSGYPFVDGKQLHDVMQYVTVLAGDPVTVKRRVTQEFEGLPEPRYDEADEIHGLLARHPIEVYLTTNYDSFMSRALVREQRVPKVALCAWWGVSQAGMAVPEQYELPEGFQPSRAEPLVYHLHGRVDEPRTLVIAEQDYVEFLHTLARGHAPTGTDVVPTAVLRAMSQTPLLFVGYSLRDWSFRMLFHAIAAQMPRSQQRQHVSVQLVPEVGPAEDAQRKAMEYLISYYRRLNISVFWGTCREFCAELSRRLEAPSP